MLVLHGTLCFCSVAEVAGRIRITRRVVGGVVCVVFQQQALPSQVELKEEKEVCCSPAVCIGGLWLTEWMCRKNKHTQNWVQVLTS